MVYLDLLNYQQIYGGPDEDAKVLAELCNTIKSSYIVTSPNNYAFVRFKTDGSYSGKGFSTTYEAIKSGMFVILLYSFYKIRYSSFVIIKLTN